MFISSESGVETKAVVLIIDNVLKNVEFVKVRETIIWEKKEEYDQGLLYDDSNMSEEFVI